MCPRNPTDVRVQLPLLILKGKWGWGYNLSQMSFEGFCTVQLSHLNTAVSVVTKPKLGQPSSTVVTHGSGTAKGWPFPREAGAVQLWVLCQLLSLHDSLGSSSPLSMGTPSLGWQGESQEQGFRKALGEEKAWSPLGGVACLVTCPCHLPGPMGLGHPYRSGLKTFLTPGSGFHTFLFANRQKAFSKTMCPLSHF